MTPQRPPRRFLVVAALLLTSAALGITGALSPWLIVRDSCGGQLKGGNLFTITMPRATTFGGWQGTWLRWLPLLVVVSLALLGLATFTVLRRNRRRRSLVLAGVGTWISSIFLGAGFLATSQVTNLGNGCGVFATRGVGSSICLAASFVAFVAAVALVTIEPLRADPFGSARQGTSHRDLWPPVR